MPDLLPAPDPLYAEPRSSSSVWLKWHDVEGAENYLIYMGDSDDFSESQSVSSVLQGIQVAVIDNLISEHEYFVWVVPNEVENQGTASGPVKVTTLSQVTGGFDLDGIKNAIWAWADGVIKSAGLADLAIWANQDGTRQQGEHVQLGIAGPMMPGATDSIISTTDRFVQRGLRSFLISVNVYSPTDAISLATRLQASLCNPVLRAPLVAADIGSSKTSDVRDLTAFMETRWERRAQFDFVIFVSFQEEIVQDVIESVKIQNITPA